MIAIPAPDVFLALVGADVDEAVGLAGAVGDDEPLEPLEPNTGVTCGLAMPPDEPPDGLGGVGGLADEPPDEPPDELDDDDDDELDEAVDGTTESSNASVRLKLLGS